MVALNILSRILVQLLKVYQLTELFIALMEKLSTPHIFFSFFFKEYDH